MVGSHWGTLGGVTILETNSVRPDVFSIAASDVEWCVVVFANNLSGNEGSFH